MTGKIFYNHLGLIGVHYAPQKRSVFIFDEDGKRLHSESFGNLYFIIFYVLDGSKYRFEKLFVCSGRRFSKLTNSTIFNVIDLGNFYDDNSLCLGKKRIDAADPEELIEKVISIFWQTSFEQKMGKRPLEKMVWKEFRQRCDAHKKKFYEAEMNVEIQIELRRAREAERQRQEGHWR